MTYGKEQQTSKPIFNISLSHLLFFVTTLSSLLQGVGLEPTTISSLFTWLLAQLGRGTLRIFYTGALPTELSLHGGRLFHCCLRCSVRIRIRKPPRNHYIRKMSLCHVCGTHSHFQSSLLFIHRRIHYCLGLVSYPIHGFLHIPDAGRRCRRSL